MNPRKILYFSFGPLGNALISVFTIPLLTYFFKIEDIGKFNLFQVALSFCLLLSVLGLDQAYVREFHESRDQPQLLKACFTPGFVLLLICGSITVLFADQLAKLLYDSTNPVFYWITVASVVVTFASRFLSLILRMQERGLAFSISQVTPKVLFLAIFGVIVFFDLPRNFLTLLWTFFASSIAVVFIYLWNTRNQWRQAIGAQFERQQILSLLNFGMPLIFSGLAYWGLTATSSIALRSLSTFLELGIYSVTISIASVAAIFQSIFSVVWAPIVYKWVAEGVDVSRIDRVARQALALVCALLLVCGIFSWLADYFLPAQYEIVKYLVLCAIMQPLLYTLSEITCIGISITRRTTLLILITVAALCANVLLSLWLVPLHGATGAVVANAVAYLVFFVARTEVSASVWRQFPRARLYVFTSLAVTFAVGTVAWGTTLPFHYAFVWVGLVPVVGWCFRVEISELGTAYRNAWGPRANLQPPCL